MQDIQINAEENLLGKLNSAFSPSAPIDRQELFFGRIDQLGKIVETINEREQHAVLYGERGVGKTSLANIAHLIFRSKGIMSAKITCSRTDTFNDIWRKIFKRISFIDTNQGIGFEAKDKVSEKQLDLFLPAEKEVDINDLLIVFDKITNPILLIFDEFDSFKNLETVIKFTDTIKAISDNAPNVTVLIVGIAESVNELIGSHASIGRSLRQILLQTMSNHELEQIVKGGLKLLNFKIDNSVLEKIIKFSNGFPHYTHLLSKYSAKRAIITKSEVINENHFKDAIDGAIENAQESVRSAYQMAVITGRETTKFEFVLWACAMVKEDEHGTFKATDLMEPMFNLTGKRHALQSYSYHLGKLCQEEKGKVLNKIGKAKQYRYRFNNPLLKSYIKLKLYKNNLL